MANKPENDTQLNRRPKPNLGGRPRLEEIAHLTPEMEEIAQKVRAGYTAAEIADDRGCPLDRVEKLLANPVCEARIKKLFGDRLNEITLARDRLFDEGVASAIRLMRTDELPPQYLDFILRRYDPFERLMNRDENEKKLVDDKPTQSLLPTNQTSKIVGTKPKTNSVFQPLDIHDTPEEGGEQQ